MRGGGGSSSSGIVKCVLNDGWCCFTCMAVLGIEGGFQGAAITRFLVALS